LEKMLPNSSLHQLAKCIVKFSFRSISRSSKCSNACYALSLPFMRKSADASSATSGTTFPCFSRTRNKEWVNSELKTDMFGWASTTNKSLHGFPARS
jgi:hypothetical protein